MNFKLFFFYFIFYFHLIKFISNKKLNYIIYKNKYIELLYIKIIFLFNTNKLLAN